jgi:predicted transcriptional regulator
MKSSAKEKVMAAVKELPADATIEDAMERLYFLSKIERGVSDADAGRLTDHEEVRAKYSRA